MWMKMGVPTKDSYESLSARGTFSNAQTQGQEASFIFIKDEASITVKIFEYNTEVPSTSQASFQDVVLTKPDGNVAKIKRVFFTKKGALFFSKGKFCEKDQICLWHLLESWVVNKDNLQISTNKPKPLETIPCYLIELSETQ